MPKKRMPALYLTTAEATLFAALPEAVTKGHAVTPETSEVYETEQQLEVRRRLLEQNKKFLALKAQMETMQSESPAVIQKAFADQPTGAVLPMVFALGARYLTQCIGEVLKSITSADEVEGLLLLSDLRHQIFAVNA